MKVLTASEMREVDRLTIAAGIPGIILMENAAHSVVEEMARYFGPLSKHRIAIICGKGNNGGDGLAIARLLAVRHRPEELYVTLLYPAPELTGDAATNFKMLSAAGVSIHSTTPGDAGRFTIVVDAVLGTGISGPAQGVPLEAIRAINRFPLAKVVAVDLPSGMDSDSNRTEGEFVRADLTVTFTAPKRCHALAPSCDHVGVLAVKQIGSPSPLMDPIRLNLSEAREFTGLFGPRPRNCNKGNFGHVLLVGGAGGKTGAVKMAGAAALKAGAGLVTVASEAAELIPDLMTGNLWDAASALGGKSVLAIGPGLGQSSEANVLLNQLLAGQRIPTVIDADGLNLLAAGPGNLLHEGCVLTPHPGEMGRLLQCTTGEVEADRLGAVRRLVAMRGCIVVLKGQRTLIAAPDGQTWINPTGSPAMAKGGSGDVLTGMIAGLAAQHPASVLLAVRAAVYLHGLCGELGAAAGTEQSLLASELIQYLPEAIRSLSPGAAGAS